METAASIKKAFNEDYLKTELERFIATKQAGEELAAMAATLVKRSHA